MSHTTVCDETEIKSLDAMAAAAVRCGGVLTRDSKKAKSYDGRRLSCDHVISHPAAAYEIGLRKSTTKPGTYDMVFDDFCVGGLDDVFSTASGKSMDRLRMFYDLEADRIYAASKGYSFREIQIDDTKYVSEMVTPDALSEVAMTA